VDVELLALGVDLWDVRRHEQAVEDAPCVGCFLKTRTSFGGQEDPVIDVGQSVEDGFLEGTQLYEPVLSRNSAAEFGP